MDLINRYFLNRKLSIILKHLLLINQDISVLLVTIFLLGL